MSTTSHPLRPLWQTGLTAALLAVLLAFFVPAGTVLQLYDRETEQVILEVPVEAGDCLSLEIEHSAEFIPWFEFYTVTADRQFLLTALAVGGYGAGVPANYDVPHRIEDGLVWMEEINRPFPELRWLTSDTFMKELTLNDTVIFDFRTLPNGSRVRAAILQKRGILS